ncbi:MAG: phytanoyl-CoA dioxygenase family protein [Granulosicoccus sp.]|nr:phytanoyl-CoA dioxygenase family protein [Granulosicoccus sp.]
MNTSIRQSGLTEEQLQHFDHCGFVIIEDLLDQEDLLQSIRREYADVLNQWCDQWVQQQLLSQAILKKSFEEQLIAVYRSGLDYCQPLDISLPPGKVFSDTPFHAGPAVFELLVYEPLLACVESVLGSELTSNPIQHVRIKPPEQFVADDEVRSFITSTEWHQDRATALSEADNTEMVTVWAAITDATEQNGCLQVIPGSHRKLLNPHCPLPQLGIPDKLIESDQALPLPVRSGSVILFHPLTIHGSLPNKTSSIRWSFDLRFHKTGQPSGRPMFPSFIARSRMHPANELRDASQWKQMWLDARDSLSAQEPVEIHRWRADASICA